MANRFVSTVAHNLLAMKLFYCLLLFVTPAVFAQKNIQGKVTDHKGNALPGANVFLKGTYDGGTTDANGVFAFQTSESDTATLAASYVGFEVFEKKINLKESIPVMTIKLEELANELNTVVITAGAFEASDEKRMAMLKTAGYCNYGGCGGGYYRCHAIPAGRTAGRGAGGGCS